MKEVNYIDSVSLADIVKQLSGLSGKGCHFTNGTYAYAAELIIPTTLAGFKYVVDKQPHLPLVIAINSDKSMRAMGKEDFEPQNVRAQKVAEPLAKTFPENQVVIIYYDEQTPNALYEALNRHNLTRTLHKWGFGTSPEAPKIEAAEQFELTYAFPLPNDTKPVCYHDTPVSETAQKITVVDLRGDLIVKEGVLFDLPEDLQSHHAPVTKPELKI